MKKTIIILIAMMLSSCSNGYSKADYPVVPPELSDCKFFNLMNDKGGAITVVRCPNSTTTTKANKQTTVVIDGVEYEAKESSLNTAKPQDSIPN